MTITPPSETLNMPQAQYKSGAKTLTLGAAIDETRAASNQIHDPADVCRAQSLAATSRKSE